MLYKRPAVRHQISDVLARRLVALWAAVPLLAPHSRFLIDPTDAEVGYNNM
jgi:hypothetical protein